MSDDEIPEVPTERLPSERISSAFADPALSAQVERMLAGAREVMVAGLRAKLALRDCIIAMSRAGEAMAAWDTVVGEEIGAHPDLAELNVQMDGFYGDPEI